MGLPVLNKQTGQVENRDGAGLETALRSGEVALLPERLPEGRIKLVDEAGELFSVKAEELESQLGRGGFRIAGDGDIRSHEARNSPVRAALEGAARGATGGASDAVLANLAASSVQPGTIQRQLAEGEQEIRARQEENPIAATVGEAAGFLGTAAIPGAPARGALALGSAVERAVAQRTASLAARLSAGSAVEGAFFGMGQALSEDLLGNPEEAAQAVVANVGLSAALGGALGGAAGLGRSLARRVPTPDVLRAFERHAGSAVPDPKRTVEIMDRVRTQLDNIQDPGKKREVVRSLLSPGDEGKALRQHLLGPNKADDVVRDIRSLANNSEDLTRKVSREAVGSFKRKQIAKAVRRGNEADVIERVSDMLGGLDEKLTRMEADASRFRDVGAVKSIRKVLGDTQNNVKSILEKGDNVNAELFLELDAMKRRFAKPARLGKPLFGQDVGIQDTVAELAESHGQIRKLLESEELFGEAGALQSNVNAAWSNWFQSNDLFRSNFLKKIGDGRFTNDPAKISTYVNGLSKARNDLRHEALVSRLSAQEKLAAAIGDSFDLSDEAKTALSALSDSNRELRRVIDTVEKDVVSRNVVKEWLQTEANGLAGQLRPMTAAVLGGLGGGVGGAVLGGALTAATKPVSTAKILYALESRAGGTTQRVAKAVTGFFRGAKKAATKAARIRATAPLANALSFSAGEDKQKKYRETAAKILELSTTAPHTEAELAAAAPQIATFIQLTTQQALSYAAARMPAAPLSQQNFFNGGESNITVSELEIEEFAQVLRGLEDPLSILDDLEARDVDPIAVQTVKDNYPHVFNKMQAQVMEQLMERYNRGEQTPYEDRIALGVMFDLPTDPSLEPGFILNQQVGQAQRQQEVDALEQDFRPSGIESPSAVAQPNASPTDRIINRRLG